MLENNIKQDLFLAAIYPYIDSNEVSNTEQKVSGKDFIVWGDNNNFPNFLWECYNNCATLQSIINGTSDYVAGNDVICNVKGFDVKVNKKGETMSDIVQKISMDYLLFGSFAIQILRNMIGEINEIYWIDINKLRSDEKNEVFFYSDDWNKSYGRVKYITYPKFNEKDKNPSSIFYFKGNKTRSVYGTPLWNAAIKNVQIDRAITDFHNNEVQNNFMGSKLISFNSGVPDENMKLEIEKNLNEKFSGAKNAGRFVISFSQSKENAPEILNLSSDDFDKRYIELEKRNSGQIFVAFRAIPQLFGLVVEGSGFNREEYLQAFALYNRTIVKPIQQNIIRTFDKIFGVENSVTITPFTVDVVDDISTKTEIMK